MMTNKDLENLFNQYQDSLESRVEISNGIEYWHDKKTGKTTKKLLPGYHWMVENELAMKGPLKGSFIDTMGALYDGMLTAFGGESRAQRRMRMIDDKNARIDARNAEKSSKFDTFVRKELTQREKLKEQFTPVDSYRLYER